MYFRQCKMKYRENRKPLNINIKRNATKGRSDIIFHIDLCNLLALLYFQI